MCPRSNSLSVSRWPACLTVFLSVLCLRTCFPNAARPLAARESGTGMITCLYDQLPDYSLDTHSWHVSGVMLAHARSTHTHAVGETERQGTF